MSGRDHLLTVVGLFSALVLFSLAWGCYWKSRFHSAKAEVYQEWADTYSAMALSLPWTKKELRRVEAKRRYMSLALCDPRIRDGLADALEEAEQRWHRMSDDEPRDWRIVRSPA